VKLKYELIAAEKATYPVTMMTRLLGVSRAAYYAWTRARDTEPDPTSRAARRERLKDRIAYHHEESRQAHGVRRIRADLAENDGEQASVWLVAKLMREQGLAGVQPRTSKRTTVPDPGAPARPDRLRRRFNPPVATTQLVGDITYLRTSQGWLYLATVIDLTTRMVVGWQTSERMTTPLICDALSMAHKAGYVAGNAIFHSDRGSQYTSAAFADHARTLDVRLSVGRTGSCHDNAVAESFFSMLKNEMYHRYTFTTRARARLAVADYIEVFYNRRRRHSTLDYRTPAQAMHDHLNPPNTTITAAAA
jgi:transposase InsO family protein